MYGKGITVIPFFLFQNRQQAVHLLTGTVYAIILFFSDCISVTIFHEIYYDCLR